jgi:ABC-type phosphate/phosphonate transport system permease subunit
MYWLLIVTLFVAYVLVFNKVANAYFESKQKMTWNDVIREFFPTKINIEF